MPRPVLTSAFSLLIVSVVGCGDDRTAQLVAELRHTDLQRRKLATETVAHAPHDAPEVTSALAEGVAADDAELRRLSAFALGNMGPAAASALPALSDALEDPDHQVRLAAALAMLQIDPQQEPPRAIVLAALRAGNPHAMQQVGRLGPTAQWAAPALRRLISDHHPPTRLLAAQSLEQIEALE